jgi:hypothetical protein
MVCTPSIVVTAHDVLAGRRSGRCCLTGRRSPRSCSGSVEGISAPWSFGWVGECPRYAMVLASRVRARSAFRSACLLPLVPVSHSHISHELSITSPFAVLRVSLTGHNTHRYSTLCRRTNCLGRTKEVGGRAADCSQPCLARGAWEWENASSANDSQSNFVCIAADVRGPVRRLVSRQTLLWLQLSFGISNRARYSSLQASYQIHFSSRVLQLVLFLIVASGLQEPASFADREEKW